MSGHDFIDWPHEPTHQMVWDMGEGAHMAGAGRTPLPPSHVHLEHITASGNGSLRALPHVSPVQWTRWPNVKPREVPATERRQGPRASRFNDLEHA
jgi:hypothetical protein